MAKTIKCKDCQVLENRKLMQETNRGSGVYAVIGTHYYCPSKKEIMTEQEILKKRMCRRSADLSGGDAAGI